MSSNSSASCYTGNTSGYDGSTSSAAGTASSAAGSSSEGAGGAAGGGQWPGSASNSASPPEMPQQQGQGHMHGTRPIRWEGRCCRWASGSNFWANMMKLTYCLTWKMETDDLATCPY